jgi:hypothetical protein
MSDIRADQAVSYMMQNRTLAARMAVGKKHCEWVVSEFSKDVAAKASQVVTCGKSTASVAESWFASEDSHIVNSGGVRSVGIPVWIWIFFGKLLLQLFLDWYLKSVQVKKCPVK